ncbi:hypothetical protein [Phaeocystidibacter luteus]|uniref:Uncharacterized protein n=1 Tax=Phaeocystidibacter luteus TaxID=911197 RepID=A0A6N6RHX2_9FLAO|nr:hypothetical protein [Phaeocystidibacter luteus]KAB2813935.1 hypothetical protein F8C67_04415 [Phaeocystidibacter luteus]
MIHPDFTYTSDWLYEQDGVRPLFKVVDEALNDTSLTETQLCDAIFSAGKAYHLSSEDKHASALESLFDALAICEYVLTVRFDKNKVAKHAKLVLICMELYLKASLFKLDEWVNPGRLSEAQLRQLETEVPLILNKLNLVRP